MANVGIGQSGISVDPFDHICVFYRGRAERQKFLVPFLTQGVADGDHCVCVVEAADRDWLIPALEVGHRSHAPSLEILDWDATYLRTGAFSPEDMQQFWSSELLASGTPRDPGLVRCACDMSWVLKEVPCIADLTAYESRINSLRPGYRYVAACLYDIGRFGGETLVQMLKTHPKVLMSGTLFENPYYLQPEELREAV
jgi:hypothetical protein